MNQEKDKKPCNLLRVNDGREPEKAQLLLNSAWEAYDYPEFHELEAHIVKDFLDFHVQHPDFYETFKNYALQAISKGVKIYSARDLLAKIRWEKMVDYGEQEFKVNNNFASCLARMFSIQYPQYKDFFEKRKKQN